MADPTADPAADPAADLAAVAAALGPLALSHEQNWDRLKFHKFDGTKFRTWRLEYEGEFTLRRTGWLLIERKLGDDDLNAIAMHALRTGPSETHRHIIEGDDSHLSAYAKVLRYYAASCANRKNRLRKATVLNP